MNNGKKARKKANKGGGKRAPNRWPSYFAALFVFSAFVFLAVGTAPATGELAFSASLPSTAFPESMRRMPMLITSPSPIGRSIV